MYSRSYTDRSNTTVQSEREEIPVEAFSDNSSEELFKLKFANNDSRYHTYEEKREYKNEGENMEHTVHAIENRMNENRMNDQNRGFFANISFSRLFGGLFEKIQLDDIILVALIFLFMSDNDKDNDILIPILLAIILLF